MTKLMTFTRELMQVIEVTKTNYEKLMKINNKDLETMKLFGSFLNTLSDTSEQGGKLI